MNAGLFRALLLAAAATGLLPACGKEKTTSPTALPAPPRAPLSSRNPDALPQSPGAKAAQRVEEEPAEPPHVLTGDWFVDEAKKRGITLLNRTGEPHKKEFIMAAVGPGAAVFDANGDGLMDIYIPNGNWLVGGKRDKVYTGPDRPRNALYIQQKDGTFKDEAKERGVDDEAWSFGCCAADLDNDGDEDLLVANLGPNRLYINDGTGHFVDRAREAGIAGGKDEWSTGIAAGDYDRDGLLDVYIANYADMFRWMRENKQIVRDKNGNIVNAAVCDWQHMKVYCGPLGLPGEQDHLYHGLGLKPLDPKNPASPKIPKFEDVTKASGVWRSKESGGPLYGFQPLFTDLNNDGWPDIYVANDSVPSFFFENQRNGKFVECAGRYGIDLSSMGEAMAGMGDDTADFNGDGLLEVNKTNFANQTNNIYVAEKTPNGSIMYRDYSARTSVQQAVFTSLSWGLCVFDYDNDGKLDIFYANGHVYPEVDSFPELKMSFEQTNQLFRNVSRKNADGSVRIAFRDVSGDAGPGLAIRKCSRGASLIDVDNDGDLDIVVVNLNDRPNLLMNRLGNKAGHWLAITLVGDPARKTNRDAIGTKLWVRAGDLSQFFETKRGESFLGCHDPRLHVGLGKHTGPVRVELTWPNGETGTRTFDKVDRFVTIRQGEGASR